MNADQRADEQPMTTSLTTDSRAVVALDDPVRPRTIGS